MSFIKSAKRTIQLESQAIAQLAEQLNHEFSSACELCLHCEGRIVVTGWVSQVISRVKSPRRLPQLGPQLFHAPSRGLTW